MATSLKTLRRFEKVGLIILGVVVMFFFTVDISLFTGSKGRQGDNSELKGAKYVTWRGGALTHGQLEQISFDHRSVMDVEQEIKRICDKDKKNPWNPKVDPIEAAGSTQDLARRYILASYANTIGLSVDDEAVISFLVKLGGGPLDKADIKSILDDTIGDTPEARTRFFSWMRRELAAKAVVRMILSSQTGIAPEAAWEQYKKVTQQAQIEFLRLPVDSYVDKVKEKPSEAELKTLYEKMKDQYRLAKYPDNGVLHAEEASFEWVKADFETFVKEEMKNVTDDQVKEYYEKNKANYKALVKPPVKPGAEDAPKPEGEATEKDGAKPEEKKAEGDKPEATGEKPAADPNGVDKPQDKPAEKPEEKPAETPKDEPSKPGADTPSTEPKDAAEDLQVSVIRNESAAQEQEPKSPEGGAQEPKPGAEKPEETKPAQEEKGEEKKADAPAGDEKATQAPANQEKPEEKPGDAKQDETKQDEAKPPQEEFRPLTEVAEDIRRELASPKADQRYKDALKNAEAELRAIWKKVNIGDGKIDQAELKKFDLEAFAAKHHLTSGVIPLCPPDIAQTYDELGKFPGFINQAYGEKTMLYEPRSITNPYGFSLDAYIYWRTEQKDSFLPKFEECREDLEKAYRYKKAKELAAKDAKDKAAEVKAGKSLKETFPEEPVLVTGHFTYLTRSPYSSGVSRIPEIEMADERFMQAVFNLKPFQATSLPIADESASYVIYLTNYKFTEAELRKQYETYPFVQELARSADSQENTTRKATFDEFMASLDEQYPGSDPDEE